VGTYQKLKGCLVTPEELARLIPVESENALKTSVESILTEAARAADLKVSDLKSVSRKRHVVLARNQAMLRMREELSLSFAEIGRVFGKDHSTVMNSILKARV